MEDKRYLTISEFTRLIKTALEAAFPVVYLKGEISNFRPSSTDHWYFVLKNEAASIKAIIFKNNQITILNLLKVNGFDTLKDGQEVVVEVRISVYEKSGEYSIIISSILPVSIGECDFIEKEINFDKSLKIIDIGCGTGRHAIELAKLWKIYLID